MEYRAHNIRRSLIGMAAGLIASFSFAGQAHARFEGPGIYKIRIAGTNQVLDIDSRWANGGQLGQKLLRWGSNDGQNQRFIVLARGDGYIIRPVHSLMCLDIPYARPDVGAVIQQVGCNNYVEAQTFYIDRLGTRNLIYASAARDRVLYAPREGETVELADPSTGRRDGMFFEFEPI